MAIHIVANLELCWVLAAGAAGTQAALASAEKQRDTAIQDIQEQFQQAIHQAKDQASQLMQRAINQARRRVWDRSQQTKQTSDGHHEPMHGKMILHVLHEAPLTYLLQARTLFRDAEDAIVAAVGASRDERSAITSQSSGSTRLAMQTVLGLFVAVGLARIPALRGFKCTSYRRFMMQHFMQRLPASGAAPTAPYTLLTSALSPTLDSSRLLSLGYLATFLGNMALPGCCLQMAHWLGPYDFLAFYLSAATVSSLAGESLAHTCLKVCSA